MENNASLNEKSIIFIGFMGAGKTTIGKLVAEKMKRDFIDIDEEIENEYKMPITEIFNSIGEKAFREREKSVITSLCEQKRKIISVGGGAFLQEDIREVCLSSCIVILLDISFEAWKNRLDLIVDSRPVLKGKSIEEMEELYNKRQAIYSKYHLKVDIDHKNVEEIVNEVIESLETA